MVFDLHPTFVLKSFILLSGLLFVDGCKSNNLAKGRIIHANNDRTPQIGVFAGRHVGTSLRILFVDETIVADSQLSIIVVAIVWIIVAVTRDSQIHGIALLLCRVLQNPAV